MIHTYFGYARVSTPGQLKGNSLQEQVEQLKSAGVPEENIVTEQYTGRTMNRPEFQKLLGILRQGDILVCTKFDRFARSVKEGLEIIDALHKKGVYMEILQFGRQPLDDSPVGQLMRNIMLSFAEFERSMIIDRMREGKEIARKRPGYHEGHPPISTDRISHALELLEGHSYRETARMTGISTATLQKYVKLRKAKKEEDFSKISRFGTLGPEDERSLSEFLPNKRPGRPPKKR